MVDRKRIIDAGYLVVPYLGWAVMRGSGMKDDGSLDHVRDVCATGTTIAIKREVLNQVGSFDPELRRATGDDVDLCWRVWLRGYRVVFVPNSRVYHWTKTIPMQFSIYGYKSMKEIRLINEFHANKNPIRILLKLYSRSNIIRYLPLAILGMTFRALYYLLRKSDYTVLVGLIKAILWNFFRFPETFRMRREVQATRKVSDDYIMNHIMTNLNPLYIYKCYLEPGRI